MDLREVREKPCHNKLAYGGKQYKTIFFFIDTSAVISNKRDVGYHDTALEH